MAFSINSLFPSESVNSANEENNLLFNLRVAMPGIVNSVNSNGTIDVQPAVRERITDSNNIMSFVNLPIIPNVPVCFPSSGGCYINMPISIGDECLLIFADTAIDYWWLYGEIQNPVEIRRHDLSDAFAILGPRSQPRELARTNSLMIKGPTNSSVNLTGDSINLTVGSVNLSINSNGVYVNGKQVVVQDEE